MLGKGENVQRVQTPERAHALNAAGALAYYQGDYAAAQPLYEESLAIRRELGDGRGIAVALNNLGNVASELGDFAVARLGSGKLRRRIAVSNSSGRRANLAPGAVIREHYRASATVVLLRARSGGWSRLHRSLVADNLGTLFLDQGHFASAGAPLEESLAIARKLGTEVAWLRR